MQIKSRGTVRHLSNESGRLTISLYEHDGHFYSVDASISKLIEVAFKDQKELAITHDDHLNISAVSTDPADLLAIEKEFSPFVPPR